MAIDLRRIRYFVTTAEEGHITRAAERLGMQQPPLSQQIKAFEKALDVQLFHRKPRGVELTQAGRALFEDARTLLAHFDKAIERTRRTARGEQGRLRIGIAPTAPFHPLVPRTIRDFRMRFPGVALTLEEGLSDEVSALIAAESMDVAFVRSAANRSEGQIVHRLLEEEMVAALPTSYAAARGRGGGIKLAALGKDPFILIGPRGTGLNDQTIEACRKAGFTPILGQQAPRITTAIGLVAAGAGVTLLPSSLRRMKMEGVVYRDIGGAARPRAFLGLVTRTNDRSAVVRRFVELVRSSARQLE